MAVRKNNTSSKAIDKDINYYKKKFWKIYFYGLGILALFFLFASWGLFGSMPSFEDLENPDSNLATEIISSDGVVLGKYFQKNRSQLKYSDLPKNLVDALVATEDARFYEHSGIDGRGTMRAIVSLGVPSASVCVGMEQSIPFLIPALNECAKGLDTVANPSFPFFAG
jgi:penicillin-binding protein 1A